MGFINNAGTQIDNKTIIKNVSQQIEVNTDNGNTWTSNQTFNNGVIINKLVNTYDITSPQFNSTAVQTTITGTTAGSVVWSMPFQGSAYKKVIIYINTYENSTTTAQSITYPAVFTQTPIVIINNTSLTPTITDTDISFNPGSTTIYNGFIILEGY